MRRLACLVVLVACGDDGSRHISDAPLQQSDGPPNIDAAISPVTVTFTRDGAPVTDTRVYFQNADSTVANTLMTDATGTASSVVGTGGSVTLVDVGGGKQITQLTTWVGVKPGDHLLLANNTPPTLFMNITVPVDPAMIDTATSYSLYASCTDAPNPAAFATVTVGSGGPTSVTFQSVIFRGCTTTDLLVVANDISVEPVSYFYMPAQTVADSTTLDLTLADPTYVLPTAHSYNITGFAGQGRLQIVDQQASTHGLVYGHSTSQTGDPIAPTVSLPTVTGGKRIIELDDTTTALTKRRYIEWGGTLDPYTTDYSTHLLPAFTSVPAVDPATHILSWAQSGGAVQSDFSAAVFNVNRSPTGWEWSVVGAGPSATIQLPTVPTDLFDFNVNATDSVFVSKLITAKVPGGYDAARPVIFATSGPQDFVTGTSGSIVANELQSVTVRPAPTWAGPRVQPPLPRVLTHRTRR